MPRATDKATTANTASAAAATASKDEDEDELMESVVTRDLA
jgi:hypothetical protein